MSLSPKLVMVICGMNRRVSFLSEMMARLHYPFLYPVCPERRVFVGFPCFLSLNAQKFRTYSRRHVLQMSLTEVAQSPTSQSASKISRGAKAEAQKALFDYLHCTRSFHFTDAEHISRNSTYFLQKLLAQVEHEEDVTRSLSRFFRYNPINEFEPFLESLGLNPSEISSVLPRNLMFLSDDHLMLENFYVLCDYGIPRSKIGKIYKEAAEIFRHDPGVLALKLRDYEELGLSKSTVVKLACCCPSLLIGGVNSEFVRLLEKLREMGLKNDWIALNLTSKGIYNWNSMLRTVEFLSAVGYSGESMRILFETSPALLMEGSGEKIFATVGWLIKLGLNVCDVFHMFSQNPQILSDKFVKNVRQAVVFLFEIGMEIKEIANIVSKHMHLMGSHSYKGPNTVLRKLKVGKRGLCQIIIEDPLKFFSLASKSSSPSMTPCTAENPSKLLEKTTFLLSTLRYTENSEELMKALKQFRGRGDQLQERYDCLVHAGLDCNVVASMIKQAPSVLNQSKDMLEKKIACLRNCLGYPLESIVVFPMYLCYDLERINLRFSMYAWLREKGAAKPKLSLSTLLACSDKRFVRYFVSVHPEGPAMWQSLQKSS